MNVTYKNIPFQTIDWNNIPKIDHPGDPGNATWQTVQYPGVRIRLVQYSPGYVANHWCEKGHIVYCLEGEFVSELSDGKEFSLKENMMYVVTDDLSNHRSRTAAGVKLLIIDGDFLKKV